MISFGRNRFLAVPILVALLLIFLLKEVRCDLVSDGANVCSSILSRKTKYTTRCWKLLGWFSCTKYRTHYSIEYACCAGWTNATSLSSGCTVQLCSWRPDSKQCYPGKCIGDIPQGCQCAPGFGGFNCMQITNTPQITHCLAFVSDNDDEKVDVKCDDVNSGTKYTNIRATQLQVDWQTQYQGPAGTGPKGSTYPYPYYVNDYDVGIISSKVDWTIFRGKSMSSRASGSIICNSGMSANNPDKGLISCNNEAQLPLPLISGEVLVFYMKSANGGKLQITNYDSSANSNIRSNKYYSGRTLTHTASFTFDFDPPYHCLSSCSVNMLDIGSPFTRDKILSIRWNGWMDATSGIKMYQYEVYKLTPYGSGESAILDYRNDKALASKKLTDLPSPLPTLLLDNPGVYCVLLIVYDNASDTILEANHRLARRFLLYDNSSQVEKSDQNHHKLFVNSAAANTSYEWITTLNKEVSITWKSHFFNEDHKANMWLNAISSHTTDIDEDYEDITGPPHETRSMEAIPNINGIIRYDFMYATDQNGGRTLTLTSSTWESLVNFQNEEEKRTIPRVDGDSIKFWVNAFDVMNNTLLEDVLVHVDSSPPHIDKVGLLRDGQRLLAVHSNVDLFDMILEFDTYDYHSGTKQITWALHDMKDLTSIGQGSIPVVRMNKQNNYCAPPRCYCIAREEECFIKTYQIIPELIKLNISFGEHDFDYVFVITVVNNAMLQTLLEYQVTIDVSPPVTGHVFDSYPGQKDSDYQSSLLIPASWNGFFDRESGIKYYKWATHTTCLTKSDFETGGSPPVQITTSFDTFSSQTVSITGTYYTTVVAYNHALEPSHPVCSDGITVDTTPPVVGSIHVKNAFIKPGLVSDGNNMMYMDGEGYVYELLVQSKNCRGRIVNDVSNYESKSFPHYYNPQQLNCSSYTSAGKVHYLATENIVEMTWAGSDVESLVHDFMIAFSSTNTANGDILPYTSTHGNLHYITYHPNLANRQVFYVSIKARNKAGLETIEVVGPFKVRVDGPEFDAEITITHQRFTKDVLVATFSDFPYSIDDIHYDYLSSVEYSLGENSCSGNLISWSIIAETEESFGCNSTWPQTCIVIDTELQGFHLQDTSYCLSIRLRGYNRLSTTANAWYSHRKSIPAAGILWEINPDDTDPVKKDIDFQISTRSLHLRFILYGHDNKTHLQYLMGVGTTPGTDDIKSFEGFDIMEIVKIKDLHLQLKKKYFTTIKIVDSDSGRYSVIKSNGVMVLAENIALPGFIVYDGIECFRDDTSHDRSLGHHEDVAGVPSCGVDIDYQTYTTVMSAFWNYTLADAYIQYFLISVDKQDTANGSSWLSIQSDHFVGLEQAVQVTGLHLEGGETYRIVTKGCHPAGCYKPVETNGVTILPDEPVAKNILHVEYSDNATMLTITWNPFLQPYHGIDFDLCCQYAVALFVRPDNSDNMQQITKWMHFRKAEYHVNFETNEMNGTYTLDHKLEASACLLVGVRGYNRAMLFATAYKEFLGCTVPEKYPTHIYDAVGNISLTANDAWNLPDAEYTPSKTSLSAVWPTLRHGLMKWSVVHGDIVNRVAYKKTNFEHLDFWDFDCAAPEVLACGSTNDRFVNVHNLNLQEGFRYHICLYANTTTTVHEKWVETLPEISECTNGITVDTEPPIGGIVWIGNRQEHSNFQSDNLIIVVHWSSFLDVEVSHRTAHTSGIRTYLLAIGTSTGSQDVLDFQDVGLTNFKIIMGLILKSGETYYVTIKAQDFVGHETSVVSYGATLDNTLPIFDMDKLKISGRYLTTENSIHVTYANGAFRDPESGIVEYKWCIGSKQRLCDTLERTRITEPGLSITSDTAMFLDGQKYYLLLEAFNGAGLSVSTPAATFVVDASAPLPGFVHEVDIDGQTDIDYQVSTTSLSMVWGDFIDPESTIVEYRLTIGSCPNCSDISNDVYVGLVKAYQINHLHLKPGTEYYTRVMACNSAGLCTSVSSDGITVDRTPPHLGSVYDGLYDTDNDYQHTNNIVQVHLENVHDLQSGISFISWWAGTSSGATDIFGKDTAHSHVVLQKRLNVALSDGTTIYTTVKACNKAGLCTEKTSDGTTIDTTAPSVVGEVELMNTTGTLLPHYQIYRNTVALQWLANEEVSPIVSTYISVLPQKDAHLSLPTVKLMGNPESHVIGDLELRDGDIFVAQVTVCNAANLCTRSLSKEFMVDSSPPTSGAFAVDTDHAIELYRDREGWMTYDNAHIDGPQVKLAWVGFQDPHSDILSYSVKIGTDLHNADIADFEIVHQTIDKHRDEGFVNTENCTISQSVNPNDHLYITIYGTNKAGLNSDILQGLFIAIPSGGDTGSLELERRCSTRSCIGHCTCAPHGFHGCDTMGTTCTDKAGSSNYANVTVYDKIPRVEPGNISDVGHIPTMHILHATWTIGDGIKPKWFDWSVGIKNKNPGNGLLDINRQPVWYEVGSGTTAVFSMTNSKLADQMSTHTTYVFYVKGWYDEISYAVFQSDGVQVDATAPELSDSYTVIEVFNPDSSADVDFTSSASTITIKWANVFRDGQSGLVSFEVTILSDKLLSVIVSEQVTSDIVELTMAGLSLIHGEHYTSKVVACNNAGFCSDAMSDGFLLDTTPPNTGTVLDGRGFHDIDYAYDNREVTASWQGFHDDESFIASYIWCITVGRVEISCTDVGLQQQMKMSLAENVTNGEMVLSTVYAINGANLTSIVVTSDGFIVDQSPPTDKHNFNFEKSVIVNGQFQSDTAGWEINAEDTSISDNKICISDGFIKQDVPTKENQKYRLQFDAVNGYDFDHTASLGYFQFGRKEHHMVYAVNNNDGLHARQNVYFVITHSSTSSLQFGTMTDMKLCISNIRLECITEGLREERNNGQHPETSFNSSVHVHVIASSAETTLMLNWDFVDLETPLLDYMFAVGTVKGGIQLQDFESTGVRSTSTLSALKVQHGTVLHVTVVATNAVGLSTVVYADPVTVDLTPPVIELFEVNNGDLVLSTLQLNIFWQARDQESGIEKCDLSIDFHMDPTVDLIHLSWKSNGNKSLSLPDLKHGDTLTCTLNCKSFRNMYSEAAVGPLTYVTEAPNTDNANIFIVPYSETFHSNRDNYFTSANMVWFRWDGIVDPIGIESCQITVNDGETDVLEATPLGSNRRHIVVLQNGTDFQENIPYIVNLTCFNKGGFASEPVTTSLFVDSTMPSYTGERLGIFWRSDDTVHLNWDGLFAASSDLIYELNLGTAPGGISILSWVETKDTGIEVTHINSAVTHYLSISAITQSGLYVTKTFTVEH